MEKLAALRGAFVDRLFGPSAGTTGYANLRIGQRAASAADASPRSGLTATGRATARRTGRSLRASP